MTKTDIHKKAMVEAMKQSLGIVSEACKIAGVCRQQHYTWLKDDSEYKKDIDDISEDAIDFAETALRKKIAKGDTTAIIFYLKTKGKSRGYIEKTETEHSGEIKGQTQIVVSSQPAAEALKKIINDSD